MRTKPSRELLLSDRLSHLSHNEALRLLGPRAKQHLREGGELELRIDEDVHLDDSTYVVRVAGAEVRVELDDAPRKRLRIRCSRCTEACLHQGAALAFLLEEKTSLGLAVPPADDLPLEHLSEAQLGERELAERRDRARAERMRVQPLADGDPWTDYLVTNATSGKTWRVALRGAERGMSFCSCPDFRKNALGTCKHVLRVLDVVTRKFTKPQLARPYVRTRASLSLRYGNDIELWLSLPERLAPAVARVLRPFAGRAITRLPELIDALRQADSLGHVVKVYPDAEEYLEQRLLARRLARVSRRIRMDPAAHPLRRSLLTVELLPYQLDGIAFAAGAGRAILADDMGLGKTIQAIGVAELLGREAGVRRVLVVCPASVKAQWRAEIERFAARSVQLIAGGASERAASYRGDAFFTICNYEQVLRDLLAVERVEWDLIVLDEAQRIKNWEGKTSRVLKALRSRFALALTGTPLENRLEELYSVVEFIDDRRLGSLHRFRHRHRLVDEDGKVVGYTNLDELRKTLAPVLLRRTRAMVMKELPARSVEFVRIPPTQEQLDLHTAQMMVVSSIVRKPFLTEMDLLRLQKALLLARMAADSTFLVDKQRPAHSSKLERLGELLQSLLAERERKIVLFSEWTTMLDEVERGLAPRQAAYLRLDGSVPQGKRARIVGAFQRDPAVRLLLMTNAGSVGLNLQAANTVINVDLPWNPAILEQRIGRVHRMGQKRPVQVFVLISEDTIEENLLQTLGKKQDLALAALDAESSVEQIEMVVNGEDLKRRLEVLMGHKADAGIDRSQRVDTMRTQVEVMRRTLAPSLVSLPDGRVELRLALPDGNAFERFVQALAEAIVANPVASGPSLNTGAGHRQAPARGQPLTNPLPVKGRLALTPKTSSFSSADSRAAKS